MSEQQVALIKVPCPVEIFDAPDAYVMRRKRVAIWKLDQLDTIQPGQEEEMYRILADLVPDWKVYDVETGEPLPPLADDPRGITRIDVEQLAWISRTLRAMPGKLGADPLPK
jgi:hypothetical protein